MAYDKTYILLVTDGTAGDGTARANAQNLKWKGKMDPIYGTVDAGAQSDRRLLGTIAGIDGDPAELRQLTGRDRLYIVGHGSFGTTPKLGGKDATELARYLYENGLREVAVMSLVSCNSGWGWGDTKLGKVVEGYSSATSLPFGCRFVEALARTETPIRTEVRARVGYVTVKKTGRKIVEFTEMEWVNRLIWAPKGYNKRSWRS